MISSRSLPGGYPHGGRMTPHNGVSEALIEPFEAVAVADGELEVVEPDLSTQQVQPLHEGQTSTGSLMSGMHHYSKDGAPVEARGGPTIDQEAHAHDFRTLAQHAQRVLTAGHPAQGVVEHVRRSRFCESDGAPPLVTATQVSSSSARSLSSRASSGAIESKVTVMGPPCCELFLVRNLTRS